MTRADQALVILLRWVLGVPSLFALVAVVMPRSWIAATHYWLGLGELPEGPIVEYLARSLSLFYALYGALCLALASDLQRFRPLVRLLGLATASVGVLAIGIDLAAEMPWWWTALEGGTGIGLGVLTLYLARS